MIPDIESQSDSAHSPIIKQRCGERIAFTWSRPLLVRDQQYPAPAPLGDRTEDGLETKSTPVKLALARWQESRAKQLMLEHLASRLKIEDVAQACSLSRSHFSRAFKANTGVSPLEWFTNARLEHAKELLRSGTSALSDVALACGFSDQSHFTRVFSRRLGSSPSAWRRLQI